MQNLGAEVGEFGRFVKADDLDAPGLGSNARVGGHHAVDVGPDFNAFGIEARAQNSRGKIRPSASDGSSDAGAIRTNETAHHGNLAAFNQRLYFLAQALVGFFELRNRTSIGAVG